MALRCIVHLRSWVIEEVESLLAHTSEPAILRATDLAEALLKDLQLSALFQAARDSTGTSLPALLAFQFSELSCRVSGSSERYHCKSCIPCTRIFYRPNPPKMMLSHYAMNEY